MKATSILSTDTCVTFDVATLSEIFYSPLRNGGQNWLAISELASGWLRTVLTVRVKRIGS